MLLLATCATIASCDDFDEIEVWGTHHLDFLRQFSPFFIGIPCERWLRTLTNRIDSILFGRCFEDWVKALWPGRHDLIAIDGKTPRRTHDKGKNLKALHTLSAHTTNALNWSYCALIIYFTPTQAASAIALPRPGCFATSL